MKTAETYELITKLRGQGHKTSMLCGILAVSQSGYFDSLSRPESSRNNRRKELTLKVIQTFKENKNRYGRIRIYKQLTKQGESISEKMVGLIMRAENLKAKKKRPYRPMTTKADKNSKSRPNILKQQGHPTSPNKVIVGDITYIPTREGWLYLSGVMDLHSRMIKGWCISDRMQTSLINTSIDRAIRNYPELKGAISHSDRGCQYTSRDHQNKLREYGMISSMSAKGNCYDNAAIESFWSTLKTESLPTSGVFESKKIAKQEIFEYIEGYYNTIRMHSSLDYKTPLELENETKKESPSPLKQTKNPRNIFLEKKALHPSASEGFSRREKLFRQTTKK